MNKSIEISWDEDGYAVAVILWNPNTPEGAEPSGMRVAEWSGLVFERAIEHIKEEMVGLLPK